MRDAAEQADEADEAWSTTELRSSSLVFCGPYRGFLVSPATEVSLSLSKPIKLLVGALTLWPILYMFVFFAFIAASVFSMPRSGGTAGHSGGPPVEFMLLFAAHLGTMLMMFGLIAFYIVYLFKTDRVAQDKKALWATVIFFGNLVAMPVFFYLYVWPDEWPRAAT